MRTLVKTLLFGVLFILATNANSQTHSNSFPINDEHFKTNIHLLPSTEKVRVIFINPTEEKITVEMKNERLESVYFESASYRSYKRDLNLADLPLGRYTLEVRGGGKVHNMKILLDDKNSKEIEVLSEDLLASGKGR